MKLTKNTLEIGRELRKGGVPVKAGAPIFFLKVNKFFLLSLLT